MPYEDCVSGEFIFDCEVFFRTPSAAHCACESYKAATSRRTCAASLPVSRSRNRHSHPEMTAKFHPAQQRHESLRFCLMKTPLTAVDAARSVILCQWKGAGGDAVGVGHGAIWLTDLSAGTVLRIALDDLPKECRAAARRPLARRPPGAPRRLCEGGR